MLRRFELDSHIPASIAETWPALSDVGRWAEWSTLVACESGELREGSVLELAIHDATGTSFLRPQVVSVVPPREFVLSASVGRLGLLRMVHTFRLDEAGPNECKLMQSWVTSGLLASLFWPLIRPKMARYERLGADLAARLASA